MEGSTEMFTTIYVIWIVASLSALAWAYRNSVKRKLGLGK